MEDVQRRLQQQVQDLHLDERFAAGREILGRNAAAARDKASTMFNKLYADMESMREAQRKRAEEAKTASGGTEKGQGSPQVDFAKTQHTMNSVGARAGAYLGSWASWAGEKRKTGWNRGSNGNPTSPTTSTSSGGGWGLGIKRPDSASEKSAHATPMASPGLVSSEKKSQEIPMQRPSTQDSYGESMLDAVGSDIGSSAPGSPDKKPPAAAKEPSSIDAAATAAPATSGAAIEGKQPTPTTK